MSKETMNSDVERMYRPSEYNNIQKENEQLKKTIEAYKKVIEDLLNK
ncbi:hypothetical protein J2Z83_003750 [Virgibacillus natechei]|uniref:Transposase n=1 Tax=Virgibacillus natechei TaxID=1216297 RepID=A0ABS4IKW0_9BACI|nr:hypothetical protein [Virgibacillus natechei]MBP1971599.1 hypothetical protein [Virgibacillus natechei]UZD13070.1 hypothetical protein OLD84_00375 [Virgibacillus natechei]